MQSAAVMAETRQLPDPQMHAKSPAAALCKLPGGHTHGGLAPRPKGPPMPPCCVPTLDSTPPLPVAALEGGAKFGVVIKGSEQLPAGTQTDAHTLSHSHVNARCWAQSLRLQSAARLVCVAVKGWQPAVGVPYLLELVPGLTLGQHLLCQVVLGLNNCSAAGCED